MHVIQKRIWRARVRRAEICAVDDRWIRVKQTPLLVQNSIATWRRLNNGENLIGQFVDIRIEQLELDFDRIVWGARVYGDIQP